MRIEGNDPVHWSGDGDDFKMVILLSSNKFNFITILKWTKPNPTFGRLPIDFHLNIISLLA